MQVYYQQNKPIDIFYIFLSGNVSKNKPSDRRKNNKTHTNQTKLTIYVAF